MGSPPTATVSKRLRSGPGAVRTYCLGSGVAAGLEVGVGMVGLGRAPLCPRLPGESHDGAHAPLQECHWGKVAPTIDRQGGPPLSLPVIAPGRVAPLGALAPLQRFRSLEVCAFGEWCGVVLLS